MSFRSSKWRDVHFYCTVFWFCVINVLFFVFSYGSEIRSNAHRCFMAILVPCCAYSMMTMSLCPVQVMRQSGVWLILPQAVISMGLMKMVGMCPHGMKTAVEDRSLHCLENRSHDSLSDSYWVHSMDLVNCIWLSYIYRVYHLMFALVSLSLELQKQVD